MRLLDRLADEKIAAAIDAGAFAQLPGAGRPLVLDDDRFVPAELRAGYRMLKNGGCLPPELACRREMANMEALIYRADLDDQARRQAQKRLALLQARAGESRFGRPLRLMPEYEQTVLDRLGAGL